MVASRRSVLALVALLPLAGSLTGGCGGSSTGTDSNTNWLAPCGTDRDCHGGLQCRCGQCTIECTGDATCGGLRGGSCRGSGRAACGATSAGTCGLSCQGNADCANLGLVCGDAWCESRAEQSDSGVQTDSGGHSDSGSAEASGDAGRPPADAANSPGTGDCQNTDANPAHCGRCGHSCLGGDCVAGVCQPVTLATGQQQPLRLALTSTELYWVTLGDETRTNGQVMHMPLQGGTPTPVASDQLQLGGLALDSTSVYWTTGANLLRRAPLGGGTISPVVSTSSPQIVLVANGSAYWQEYGTNTIQSLLLAGGSAALFASSTGGETIQGYLAADATTLYWGATTTLYATPLGGGTSVPVVTGLFNLHDIAVDGGELFWTDLANGGTVGAADKDGSNPRTLASGRPGPSTLAVDGTHVYWTENGISGAAPSALMRVPRSGGDPVPLQTWPRDTVGQAVDVVVDDEAIYWAVFEAGWVMKLAKP